MQSFGSIRLRLMLALALVLAAAAAITGGLTYRAVLARHRLHPHRFVMVGNSLKSDILRVRALGGHAVHVPSELTWVLDRVEGVTPQSHGFHVAEEFRRLPEVLASLR